MAERALQPVPEGMNTLTTYLWFNGNCCEAVEFHQKALGAELAGPVVNAPDGKGVLHAVLKIGNSHFMMADPWPGAWERGPEGAASAGFWLYVEDCDAHFNRATSAGCEKIFPLADAFWGDRMGKVKDPYEHCWAFATHQWNYTPEEMQKGQEEWLESLND